MIIHRHELLIKKKARRLRKFNIKRTPHSAWCGVLGPCDAGRRECRRPSLYAKKMGAIDGQDLGRGDQKPTFAVVPGDRETDRRGSAAKIPSERSSPLLSSCGW